jgi:putative membrane protein
MISPSLKQFLQRWLVNTLAVLVAMKVVSGIHCGSSVDLLVATLVLGVLNVFLRPLLMLVSLPLLVFTLGLFTLVINALLLYFVGQLLDPHFRVDSFRAAFWGALVISLVSLVVNSLTGTGSTRFTMRRGAPPNQKPPSDDGPGGPVIDV